MISFGFKVYVFTSTWGHIRPHSTECWKQDHLVPRVTFFDPLQIFFVTLCIILAPFISLCLWPFLDFFFLPPLDNYWPPFDDFDPLFIFIYLYWPLLDFFHPFTSFWSLLDLFWSPLELYWPWNDLFRSVLTSFRSFWPPLDLYWPLSIFLTIFTSSLTSFTSFF